MMVASVGLPLLIVDGKFHNIRTMTVAAFETFIPFMVKCSLHRAGAQVINGVPEWWPSSIKYEFPLKKPSGLSEAGYRKHLSSIVCRCYWYHDAQHLLPFSAEVAKRPDKISLKHNDDNTTSILFFHNTIRIMKFNNENKNYDKKPKPAKVNVKRLLSALPKKPVIIPDIYLCENCDAEFSSQNEMLQHERDSHNIIVDDIYSRNEIVSNSTSDKQDEIDTADEIEVLEHIKRRTQKESFLYYFKLDSKEREASPQRKVESQAKFNYYREMCKFKSRLIEFSSLFGRELLDNGFRQIEMEKLERTFLYNESYCCQTVIVIKEWKGRKKVKGRSYRSRIRSYVHQYCFSKKQRISRYETLKSVIYKPRVRREPQVQNDNQIRLNEESQKLLKQCKELKIVLNRLKLTS